MEERKLTVQDFFEVAIFFLAGGTHFEMGHERSVVLCGHLSRRSQSGKLLELRVVYDFTVSAHFLSSFSLPSISCSISRSFFRPRK